ncbi:universal stress protein [Pontixanthobacter gangjinensis]|uniref:universal stress protein n=1 Tax=Pontixanthobacter gangjinensis TaxID=1028742 RepID=UPI001367F6E4|nr:universal stress protein [Pontixanthobacter gangjinensis]
MIGSQFRNFVETGPRTAPITFHSHASPQESLRAEINAPRLIACIDDGDMARSISSQALAIACSLGLEVTFARVIDAPGQFASPADPIEWQLRRRVQQDNLRRFAGCKEAQVVANSVLLAGAPAQELSDWALEHGGTMLATGRRRSEGKKGLGSTTLSLLERGEHSLLVIPPGFEREAGYRRIMVPVDGSDRGDSVLPVARRIARTHGAELVLVHVVPQVELSEKGQGAQLRHLSSELDKHRERCGIKHLETLRRRSQEDGVDVRTIIRGPGDARSILREVLATEQIDLVVMASHGVTGLSDVACGSVAEYLAGHSPVPLMIVRPNLRCSFGPEAADCRNQSVFRFEG